jgi:hypothetical protein
MKTQILPSPYPWKKLRNTALFFLTILVITLISGCPPDDEDTWRIDQDGIISTWILKSAVFREEVDLDGPGNLLPITDAKSVLYDIFNVYANCSSIEEIAFEFTDEPEFQDLQYFSGIGYSAKIVCPEGQGISSWVFDYSFYEVSGSNSRFSLWLFKYNINDPLKLFEWKDAILLSITHSEVIDGKYFFYGYLNPDATLISSLPEPKPDLTFDFVFERVDPHLE